MTYDKYKDYLLLFIGLVGSIQVRIIGTFYIAELIAIASLLFIPIWDFWESKMIRKMFFLLILWLFGALFSDAWNDSPIESTIKGAFNILLLIAQIPFVYWVLKDKPSRWIFYASGAAVSYVVNFYLFREGMYETEYDRAVWELYAWSPFFIASACVLYYIGCERIGLFTLLGWSFYTLFNNSRNIFLTQVIAIVIVYLLSKVNYSSLFEQVLYYKQRIVRLFLVLAIVLFGIDNTYETLASEGYLGDRAYDKYMIQKYSNIGVASGRGDFILATVFVIHNPIIGYGSYAIDKYDDANKYKVEYGITSPSKNTYENDYASMAIPCHSHLMGTWVWHGFLAAVWWIYFMFIIWRFFRSGAILLDRRMLLMSVSFIMSMLWDVLFSPMGARMGYAYMAIYLSLIYENFEYKQEIDNYE